MLYAAHGVRVTLLFDVLLLSDKHERNTTHAFCGLKSDFVFVEKCSISQLHSC